MRYLRRDPRPSSSVSAAEPAGSAFSFSAYSAAFPNSLKGAAALAVGVAVSYRLEVPIPWAVALLAAAVPLVCGGPGGGAWSGAVRLQRLGLWIAALALGLLLPHLRERPRVAGSEMPHPDRPVEVVGEVAGPWRAGAFGASAPVEIAGLSEYRVGGGPTAGPRRAWLALPGGSRLPAPGSRIRVRGYLRRGEGFWNRRPTPPGPWRLSLPSVRLLAVEGEPGPVHRWGHGLRGRVEQAWTAALAAGAPEGAGSPRGHGAALARALVLGDRSALPESWRRGLARFGLAHLLTVSGLHLGLAAGAVFWLASPFPRFVRLALSLAAVASYLLLVGPAPSLVRASVMACLALVALVLERPPSAGDALGWAVAVMVAERPELVFDLSFQLTVSATAGILLGGPPLARCWTRRRRPLTSFPTGWTAASAPGGPGGALRTAGILRALAASAAAQLATLPFALPRFHLFAPLAPAANLLAVPWTALALGACLLWTGLALASPEAAGAFLPLLDTLAAPFGAPAAVRSQLAGALPLAVGPAAAAFLAASIYVLLLCLPRGRLPAALPWRRRLRGAPALTLASALAAASFLVARGMPERGEESPPELVAFDVGQGDSLLLRDGRRAILVDGGGWARGDFAGRVLLPALLGEGVRRLDAVVLTHPDIDHCGGLAGIVEILPTEELWTGPGLLFGTAGGGAEGEQCAGRLLRRPGLRHRVVWDGGEVRWGSWRLTVLHPEPGRRQGEEGGNDGSLVLLAETAGRKILLTGDIEARGEWSLLRRHRERLPVDLLKVAHHGSRTSTGRAFLRSAAPRAALISAGRRNRYGHPAAEVVESLHRSGARVLRTDREGAIRMEIVPGGGMRLETVGTDGAGGRAVGWP